MSDIVWWVGAATISLAAVYGLAEGALLVLDRALKAFGMWPIAWELMRRMYREKRDAAEGRR